MLPKLLWFVRRLAVVRALRRGLLQAAWIGLLLAGVTRGSSGLPAPPKNPMWHQAGIRIVDGDGHRLALHGVNLGGWLLWEGWIFGEPGSAYFSRSETQVNDALIRLGVSDAAFRRGVYQTFITKEDIHQIARAGFNVVRLPLNHRLFTTGQPQWKLVDDLLSWCEAYHIHVVLDLHGAPGGQSSFWTADPGHEPLRLWDSEQHKSATVALWRQIAKRYKDREIVAGYDILNEPDPHTGSQLRDLDQRIADAIRQVDARHLIFVEGTNFSSDFSMFDKPLCRNMAYSPHVYHFPWGADSKSKMEAHNSMGHKQKVPVWIGEFGENDHQWIDQQITQFQQYDAICGWDFWTWKKAVNDTAGLVLIQAPDQWQAALRWARYQFLPRPAASDVKHGMGDFLKLASSSHRPDKETLIALHLRHK